MKTEWMKRNPVRKDAMCWTCKRKGHGCNENMRAIVERCHVGCMTGYVPKAAKCSMAEWEKAMHLRALGNYEEFTRITGLKP
ncbi:hypothetical protein AGMMS49546_15770 [Spirochaetia bacterium]|nr:hypothetical protein FACS1894137_03610 [Spirochaetia bacterium]GHV40924.1 hypothetical protein AGMMS49546_15770 [Spirochaetia bacterium]